MAMVMVLVITIHGLLTVGIIGVMVVITTHGAGTIGDLDTVTVMVTTTLGTPLIIMDMVMVGTITDIMATDTMVTIMDMATEIMPIIEVEEAITIITRLPTTVR